VVAVVEPDRDDLPRLERRCELTCDRIPGGEAPRVDAGSDERDEVVVEVEAAEAAVHVDRKLWPVAGPNGRDAHRPILPRGVQSTA
jgi:hypothetical protein